MRKHRTSVGRCATVAAVALSAAALGVATAAADPAPIGPHQVFLGQVNGTSSNAVITVGCYGPVTPGETGHPLAGQSVDVVPELAIPVGAVPGYTGESADHVAVDFGAPATTNLPVILKGYGEKAAIPTDISLPCYGSGTVAFVPQPTSPTARTGYVTVAFEPAGV